MPTHPLPSRRLAWIDPAPEAITTLTPLAAQLGWRVEPYATLADVPAQAVGNSVDLVIWAWAGQRPMDVPAALATLLTRCPGAYIVAAIEPADMPRAAQATEQGLLGYLVHPYVRSEVETLLRRSIRAQVPGRPVRSARTQQTVLLNAASKLLAAGNEQAVLDQIVSSLVNVLGYHVAYFYRVEPDRSLLMVAQAGMRLPPADLPALRIPPDTGVNGSVVGSGQPRQIPDLRAVDEVHIKQVRDQENLVGMLSAPLFAEGDVIGVLNCHTDYPYAFSPEEVQTVTALANLAALALQQSRELQKLQTLHQTGQELARLTRLDDLLPAIARQARWLGQAAGAVIYLYDHEREVFELEAVVADGIGRSERLARNRRPRPEGLSMRVLREQVVQVSDVVQPPGPGLMTPETQAELLRLGIRSFSGWSLWQDEQSVGVLYLNYTEAGRKLTASESRVVRLFVQQAAGAVWRARLYEHSERRRALLKVTARVTRRVNRVREIWQAFLQEALSLTGAPAGNISVIRPDGQYLEHMALIGFPDEFESQPLKIGGHSLQGQVAQSLETVRVGNVHTDEKWAAYYLASISTTVSEMVVPMFIEDKATGRREVVGLINLESPLPHAFSHEHEQLLEDLCIHGKIAVKAAESYERLDQEKRRLETLARSGKVVVGSLDKRVTLQEILKQAVALTGAHFATVQEREGDTLVFRAVHPPAALDSLTQLVGGRMPLSGRGITVRAANSGRTVPVDDVTLDPDYFDGTGGLTRSEIATPLKDENGQVAGVLNVEHQQRGKFDPEDAKLLEALADLALIALRNANRYEELALSRRFNFAADQSLRRTHELNGLIGMLPATVELLAQELKLSPADLTLASTAPLKAQYLAAILKAVQDIREIFQRQVSPLIASDIGPAAVNEQIEKALAEARLPATITVVRQLQPELPKVQATEALSEVFRVLLTNARDALAGGQAGRIVITSELDPGGLEVKVSVEDNGVGIPADILQRLLRREYGVTTKSHQDYRTGLGLGLLWLQDHLQRLQARPVQFTTRTAGPNTGTCISLWFKVARP